MPARKHTDDLRTCYQENQLARDELVVAGKHLRPSTVGQDAFVLAAVEDHITPWKSSFMTTLLLPGKVRVVLSSAGHVAGIVNPPHKNAVYWVNERLERALAAHRRSARRKLAGGVGELD